MPPSGQENFSAPLSVEYMTMVLSSMPSSFSLSSSWPTIAVVLDHAIRIDAEAGLAFGLFGLRCV